MFKQILVPLDGSDVAEKALSKAAGLARMCDAKVTLLHVLESGDLHLSADFPDVYVNLHREQLANSQEYLNRQALKLHKQGVLVQYDVLDGGDIAARLLERAANDDCDLIVMSTHGRSGLERILMGSIAEEVVRHATVPVLLVNASERS